MKKIRLLFAAVLSMMAWTGAVAQTDAEYEAALAAITDGGTYRIFTEIGGSNYYVTTAGKLTATKADGGLFVISKASGGEFKPTGFKISGNGYFTNPPLSNDVANLNPGSFSTTTSQNRDTWERQVLFLNADGKYAIRSCNTAHATSSWGDAGRTFWTWSVDPVAPQYSYDPAYVWNFEEILAPVNVTYEVYDGETKVASTTVIQDANSEVAIPSSFLGISYNGGWTPNAMYNYAIESGSTIGDTDCTIKIIRTYVNGVVHALTDLSNAKAYNIYCKRGAMLTDGTTIASTSHATLHDATPANFAFVFYENNYYIYSVADKKFVLNTGYLSALPTNGKYDAIQMDAKTDPFFLFTFKINDTTSHGVNTNGTGALKGCVINTWTTPDDGDQYYMIEAADFDATEALAALEAYFHPSCFVKYEVKDALGKVIFTSDAEPTTMGAKITTLPEKYQRAYCSYDELDVTISGVNTTVTFTVTYNYPFEVSKDFASAHWYDMAMRGTWYVTSAVKAEDGAYKTQNANTMGLVEDSYQWAFLGNPYEGIKVINKAAGEGYSFGYTDDAKTNAGIPTIMTDNEGNHSWNIVANTNTTVPANSFCLNVPGTNLYINQYGGAGGSVKFWDSTNNVGDAGSAFTIFDVPTNFAEFVAAEIAPYFESTSKYFVISDAAKASIGYNESYKTECPFETYKNMKENLTAALADPANFVYPETGYYRIKSANYDGRYVTYADVEGTPTIGTAVNPEPAIANIVKLTALGDKKYNIAIEGLNVVAPAQSQLIRLAEEGAEMTAVVTTPGVGTFTNGEQFGALHCASSSTPAYYCVGWTSDAAASQWIIEDIADFSVALNAAEGKSYATFNAPFGVTLGGDVKAYAITLETNAEGDWAVPTEIGQQVPANTPVLLVSESAAASVTATINDAAPAVNVANVLKGTNVEAAPSAYVLNAKDGVVGFYALGADGKLGANKAYLEKAAGDNGEVKALKFDIATAIKAVNAAENASVFNLAGQRVNKAQKGIYIVNGKKVVK